MVGLFFGCLLVHFILDATLSAVTQETCLANDTGAEDLDY